MDDSASSKNLWEIAASCDNPTTLETRKPGNNKTKRKETGSGPQTTKSRMKTRSGVWEHFTRHKDDYDKCNCIYCGKEMSCLTTSGTSNLNKYIKGCEAFEPCEPPASRKKSQTVITHFFGRV